MSEQLVQRQLESNSDVGEKSFVVAPGVAPEATGHHGTKRPKDNQSAAEISAFHRADEIFDGSAGEKKATHACCICLASLHSRSYKVGVGERVMLAFALRCVPGGLDNADLRQCATCYKATESSEIKSRVSQSRKVRDDCETVLLTTPTLDGSTPLIFPTGTQGSGLRDSL